jgi:transcription elongation factor GreB
VDEADAGHGKIAFLAPVAQALLGKEVGDSVSVRTPGKRQELEVVAID